MTAYAAGHVVGVVLLVAAVVWALSRLFGGRPRDAAPRLRDAPDLTGQYMRVAYGLAMRENDRLRQAWKARGRELNDIYEALMLVVGEPEDPVEDIRRLGAEVARLRAALSAIVAHEETADERCGLRCVLALVDEARAALDPERE